MAEKPKAPKPTQPQTKPVKPAKQPGDGGYRTKPLDPPVKK